LIIFKIVDNPMWKIMSTIVLINHDV